MHLAGPPPPPFESARWRRGKEAAQAEQNRKDKTRARAVVIRTKISPSLPPPPPLLPRGADLLSTAPHRASTSGSKRGRSQRCRQLGGNGGRRGDKNSRLNEGERERISGSGWLTPRLPCKARLATGRPTDRPRDDAGSSSSSSSGPSPVSRPVSPPAPSSGTARAQHPALQPGPQKSAPGGEQSSAAARRRRRKRNKRPFDPRSTVRAPEPLAAQRAGPVCLLAQSPRTPLSVYKHRALFTRR